MLLMSLVATVTFTAGLTPPGGFWAADDKSNGYVAGMSVMRSKSYRRYLNFYYSNTTAFFTSLMIIGMLARNINNLQPTYLKSNIFKGVVVTRFMSLGCSYISGT
uniref:PGG domain-containing protein n=1 Tax=Triticum urartu TaxID=4572 RepID=A0A8R7UYE7_TRIUA